MASLRISGRKEIYRDNLDFQIIIRHLFLSFELTSLYCVFFVCLNFSHFHGYFDLLFAALSGYSVVFISVERWFSVWKPFEKAKYVTFKTTIITVISYITISLITFSWFPLILEYTPENTKPGERCGLKLLIIYKIFGTLSVIFTYIGK